MRADVKERRRAITALAVAAAVFLVAPSRPALAAIEGRWIAKFDRPDDRVQLTTKRRSANHRSTNSSSYSLSAFRGLVRPPGSQPAPARFELARDAGTLMFEGQLDSSGGSGRFSFELSADFAREMGRIGYALSEEDLFTAAMHDIGRAFLRGLEAEGYSKVPFDDLVAMRIHNVTPEFVRELKSLGYDGVSGDDLVAMRIHDVTTDFVREIRDLGFRDVSVDDLVSMRIHGVSADFARRARARNPGVTVDELVSMRIHGNR